MNRRGLTLLSLLAILAAVALLTLVGLAYRAKSRPLTEERGRYVADPMLIELAATSTKPVERIAAMARAGLESRVARGRQRPGITAYMRGICAQYIAFAETRLASTTDPLERQRLEEFLTHLRQMCIEAQASLTEPG